MSNTVTGQKFEIVTCQSCENDVSFQKPRSSPPEVSDMQITCSQCGHVGVYNPAHIRQAQQHYPL